ncbi:hypothetical protein CJ030_MR5G013414 [Morella rubra]|uniref:Uncharacterized protein n=1 Tax=Morella rubra TaxID=262757 RepID=A0A6A1VP75_9ROSI|nr:hypothetical protein CJ030_MR5G013414 [Morella rubra]
MAFRNPLFVVVALILALSISSNDMSLAARHLLDTPAAETTNSALPPIPSLPTLPVPPIHKLTQLPYYRPEQLTQLALPKPGLPMSTSPQLAPPPLLTGTTFPRLSTNPLPATRPYPTQPKPHLSSTQIPSLPTLPKPTLSLLPNAQIPTLPTEPTLTKLTSPSLPSTQAPLLASPTFPNMPADGLRERKSRWLLFLSRLRRKGWQLKHDPKPNYDYDLWSSSNASRHLMGSILYGACAAFRLDKVLIKYYKLD